MTSSLRTWRSSSLVAIFTSLTDELIASSVMITAGRDTVGHNTARAVQALAEHPEVQRKLRAEILEAAATSQNGEPDFARLNDMPYLEAVIRETIRL